MKYLKLNATSTKVSNPIVSLANNKLGVSRLNDGENHLITETGNVYPDSNVCLCSPNFIQDKGNYGGNYEFSDYYNPEYLIYVSCVNEVEKHKFVFYSTFQTQERHHPKVYVTNNNNIKKAYYFIQNVDVNTYCTTPFEVQKIYILETPADSECDTTTISRNEFIAFQEPYNDKFIYEFYKKLNQDGQPLGLTDTTHGGLYELDNYTGDNFTTCHYFLYYQNNPGEKATNWTLYPNIINENYTIPAKTLISIGSASTIFPQEEYNYWEGKYFVLESVDNPEITDDFDINIFPTASNMYTMLGNYTLHPVEVQLDENYQLFDEESRQIYAAPEGQTTTVLRHGNGIIKYTE